MPATRTRRAPATRTRRRAVESTPAFKTALFLLLSLPLVLLGVDVGRELDAPGSALGPDPQEALVHHLGTWALRCLLLTLAVSPAAHLARRPALVGARRMIGLWAFAYMALHFGVYLVLLAGLDPLAIAADLYKRPYITVGFAALVALAPLAATSTRGWQRRLGRRWKALHRLIYPAAIAAWTHLLWLSKASYQDAAIYGAVLALLLGERLVRYARRRR